MRRFLPTIVMSLCFWAGIASAAEIDVDAALKERVLGDPDAPVTVIEYSSLTCPHCAGFHREKLPAIKEKYIDSGKVKLVYRDFPWDQAAAAAALLARCAPEDRYFKFLDALFLNQEKWATNNPIEGLARLGKMGGISEETFQACLNEGRIMDGIIQSRMSGTNDYKINSTPTFIVQHGGDEEKIEGNVPLEDFEAVLDKFVE